MSDFILDAARLLVGVGFGLAAIAFGVTTARLMIFGQDAYRTNQKLTPQNPFQVFSGQLRSNVRDADKRASHGIAVSLASGELQPQRRLSTEAVDDVIGRRAGQP